eukprot:CAMPEP_0184482176 /NCGR_PEP_ID=MMETSP0113_2-20130426/3753_1 /TAXON_ID=91329 /ORGANISM="Norrisiella sphaerica, Strain BC52" /LENGTH=962 /DNA_ID=CAMNT_0026861767 /DNA_START=322 /DNA_END=3211 /DNA_ORIENTATION=+
MVQSLDWEVAWQHVFEPRDEGTFDASELSDEFRLTGETRRLRGGSYASPTAEPNLRQATQLLDLLNNCMSPSPNLRTQSEAQLEALMQNSYSVFASNLVKVMMMADIPIPTRQQAGLYLKNTLSAKEPERRRMMHERWLSIPEPERVEVKQGLLQSLETKAEAIKQVSAQVIAKVFGAEVGVNGWSTLVEHLSGLVGRTASSSPQDAVIALKALGYVCEEMDEDNAPQKDINQALTAIIASMNGPSPDQVHAAVNALRSAIHLTRQNFEIASERDMIMKMLCQAASSSEVRIRMIGFESLGLIAERFYSKLGPYMEAIYTLSVNSLQNNDQDDVMVLAIEFWSTLAEVEDDILYESAHHAGSGGVRLSSVPGGRDGTTTSQGTEICMNYIKAVAPHLVPVLNSCLTKQDDFDDNAWTAAKAAAACLELMTHVTGDDMLHFALPLIHQNMQLSGWREREAGMMALGSILDGPSKEVMIQNLDPRLVIAALDMLSDSKLLVRDTAAWLMSRIAQHIPEMFAVSIPHSYPQISSDEATVGDKAIKSIVASLEDTPRVATKSLSAIYYLAKHDIDTKRRLTGEVSNEYKSILQKYYEGLMRQLHAVAERPDGNEDNLSSVAFQTIMQLVKAATSADQKVVDDTLRHAISRAQQTLSVNTGSVDQKETVFVLQSHLVGVIESCLMVGGGSGDSYAQQIMAILFKILQSENIPAHQDCLRTAGLLASSQGSKFGQYMAVLWPYLAQALQNTASASSYITAVLAVSDITRAMEGAIANYSEYILSALLNALSSPTVESRAKPPTLSAIGDIAMAISGNFARYSGAVLNVMKQATEFDMAVTEPEGKVLRNELWEGLLTAYSGILIGLKGASPQEFAENIKPHTSTMVNFVRKIVEAYQVNREAQNMENVLRASCGLLGDIAGACGPQIAQELRLPFIKALIEECSSHSVFSKSTKDTASYARQSIYGTI